MNLSMENQAKTGICLSKFCCTKKYFFCSISPRNNSSVDSSEIKNFENILKYAK